MIYNHINASNFCFVWLVCSLTSSPINTRDFCLVWSAYSLTWSSNNTNACCLVWLICSQSTDLQPYKYQYKWLLLVSLSLTCRRSCPAGWSTGRHSHRCCHCRTVEDFHNSGLSTHPHSCTCTDQGSNSQCKCHCAGMATTGIHWCWSEKNKNMNSCEQVLWKKIWDK